MPFIFELTVQGFRALPTEPLESILSFFLPFAIFFVFGLTAKPWNKTAIGCPIVLGALYVICEILVSYVIQSMAGIILTQIGLFALPAALGGGLALFIRAVRKKAAKA